MFIEEQPLVLTALLAFLLRTTVGVLLGRMILCFAYCLATGAKRSLRLVGETKWKEAFLNSVKELRRTYRK